MASHQENESTSNLKRLKIVGTIETVVCVIAGFVLWVIYASEGTGNLRFPALLGFVALIYLMSFVLIYLSENVEKTVQNTKAPQAEAPKAEVQE